MALALAAAPALRERRSQLRASIAIVTGAVLVAVYGFVARLAFGDKLFGTWTVPTVAPFGPFVSKNHFAGYVELAALLAVGLAAGLADEARHGEGWLSWIDSRRAKWVVVAWGAAFVLVLAVPVSLSRGGVVSLAAGLAFFAALRLWARSRARLSARSLVVLLAALVAVVGLVIAVLPTESRDRILTLAGITSDQSGAYRLALWRDTLRLAASSPAVGSGFGAYEDALPRFKTTAGNFGVQHAENDHLEFLAEGGVLGTLLGGVAVLMLGLYGLARLRDEEHRLPRALLAASLAGGAALYVHSAFDFNLRIPSNALMAAAILAIGAGSVRPSSASCSDSWPARGRMARALSSWPALSLSPCARPGASRDGIRPRSPAPRSRRAPTFAGPCSKPTSPPSWSSAPARRRRGSTWAGSASRGLATKPRHWHAGGSRSIPGTRTWCARPRRCWSRGGSLSATWERRDGRWGL